MLRYVVGFLAFTVLAAYLLLGVSQQQIGRQHGEREKTHDVTQHPDSCQSFHP